MLKRFALVVKKIKLSAYADDADFLTTDVKSLQVIFLTCETFQSFSFLKLNLEKSQRPVGLRQKEDQTKPQ